MSIFKKVCVLLLILLFVGCDDTQTYDISTYDEALSLLTSQDDYITPSNYNVEVIYIEEESGYYVIIDEPVTELENFKVVAQPIDNDNIIGSAPQIGYVDEMVTLGKDQKGIILNGEVDISDFELLILVEYEISGVRNIDFCKITEILVIEN